MKINSFIKISVLALLVTTIFISNLNGIEAAFFNNQNSNKETTVEKTQVGFQNQFVNATWLGDNLVVEGTYVYDLQTDEELLI